MSNQKSKPLFYLMIATAVLTAAVSIVFFIVIPAHSTAPVVQNAAPQYSAAQLEQRDKTQCAFQMKMTQECEKFAAKQIK